MQILVYILLGFAVGLGVGLVVAWWRVKDVRALTAQMLAEKTAETDKMLSHMKESFGALSLEALSKNTEEFLKVAGEKLGQHTEKNAKEMEGKKELIDQTLKAMKADLEKVEATMQTLEKDRRAKFDVLSEKIASTTEETKNLRNTAEGLKSALANTRVRGQWGERMAEDVLRLAGLVEGINYMKQAHLTGPESASRPDYTFYLPHDRVVHMDVKFPLDNYLLYTEAENEPEKERYLNQFLKDTRARVKEATQRNYIDKDTLDYVLVFIPNEQVYAFINEHDRNLLDEAMKNKVILCSPMTLYAILAIIRQAAENFQLERTAGQVLDNLNMFRAQWEKFTEAIETVGKRLESANRAYEDLSGPRMRQLEKPLNRIDNLRISSNFEEKSPPVLEKLMPEETAKN